MKSPLEGIQVIDLSRVLTGPFATMIMGDLGAEIIKVESLGTGDVTRNWGPPYEGELSAYFMSANRNKRSISIDLKTEHGQEILCKLVQSADVVIENWRPGVAERLGASYNDLKKINPKIIYCSISGYGQDGPYRDLPSYDLIIQAMSGLMSITGGKESEPYKTGVAVADLFASFYALSGILAAIRVKELKGQGQYIDISLLDSQVSVLVNIAMNYLIGNQVAERVGNAHPNIVPYQTFNGKDGRFVVAVGNDSQFNSLCKAIGSPQLKDNPKFSTNDSRVKNRNELIDIIQRIFLKKSRDYWIDTLQKYEIPCGPINNIEEAFQIPQIMHREMVVEIKDLLTNQKSKFVGSPYKFSETPIKYNYYPPKKGEHTKEVLSEIGYSKEEISNLFLKRVIE